MKERLAAIGLTAMTALTALGCTSKEQQQRQETQKAALELTKQTLFMCQGTSEKLLRTIDENAQLGEKDKKLAEDKQELGLKIQAQMLGMTAKIASDANRTCDGDFFYFQTMRGSVDAKNYGRKGKHGGFIPSHDVGGKEQECIKSSVTKSNADLQAEQPIPELPSCEAKMQTRNEQMGIAVECTY